MSRFFVIGINPTTSEQTDSIRNWLQSQNGTWWHWIDGMWLVVSHDPNVTAASIRENIDRLTPGVHNLVLQVQPINWSGFGPKSENRNMFTWIESVWK